MIASWRSSWTRNYPNGGVFITAQTETNIARFMGISAHTVSHHLSDIFERVGCGNRTELTVRYVHEQNRGLYGKKEFSERLAQLRKAARSTVLKTSRQRSA